MFLSASDLAAARALLTKIKDDRDLWLSGTLDPMTELYRIDAALAAAPGAAKMEGEG